MTSIQLIPCNEAMASIPAQSRRNRSRHLRTRDLQKPYLRTYRPDNLVCHPQWVLALNTLGTTVSTVSTG